MDVTNTLRDVENSLRDFISLIMTNRYGKDWISSSGISQERIIVWKERRTTEEKKQKYGTIEQRLIYYSDFYDLATIIDKNWSSEVKEALGEKKVVLLFLKLLDDFRNPDAHRRELLPHQKHLIIGLSGEIRNRIVLYRSKKDTGEDYFPRLESVRDNLGNFWIPGSGTIETNLYLRPGDELIFVVTATDPLGQDLEYCCFGKTEWQDDNAIHVTITESHIGKNRNYLVCVKSKREFHALDNSMDDRVLFNYTVLPPK